MRQGLALYRTADGRAGEGRAPPVDGTGLVMPVRPPATADPLAPDPGRGQGAAGSQHPSPQQLRSMFGQNLRQLVAGEHSVAELCRRLGINRSQFNRYLQGEAFPRPDLLHRICTHFGVDARILLEPLTLRPSLPAPADPVMSAFTVLGGAMAGRDVTVAEAVLPSGIYRFWRRSFARPDLVINTLCRVWRAGGATRYRAREPTLPNPLLPEPRDITRPKLAPHHGVFLRTEDGLTLLCAIPGNRILRLSYLRPGHAGVATLIPGYTVLTRDRAAGLLRIVPSLLERLPDDMASRRSAARTSGYRQPDTLPDLLRDILMADNVG